MAILSKPTGVKTAKPSLSTDYGYPGQLAAEIWSTIAHSYNINQYLNLSSIDLLCIAFVTVFDVNDSNNSFTLGQIVKFITDNFKNGATPDYSNLNVSAFSNVSKTQAANVVNTATLLWASLSLNSHNNSNSFSIPTIGTFGVAKDNFWKDLDKDLVHLPRQTIFGADDLVLLGGVILVLSAVRFVTDSLHINKSFYGAPKIAIQEFAVKNDTDPKTNTIVASGAGTSLFCPVDARRAELNMTAEEDGKAEFLANNSTDLPTTLANILNSNHTDALQDLTKINQALDVRAVQFSIL